MANRAFLMILKLNNRKNELTELLVKYL